MAKNSCFIRANKIPVFLMFMVLAGYSCRDKTHLPALFELIDSDLTGLDFRNDLPEDDTFNIIQYLYYYNGGGVACGDLNNDGWQDIFFTSNRGSNKLYLNQGSDNKDQVSFRDITSAAGLTSDGDWSTGVTLVDINADGWLDIYLCVVGNYKQFRGRNRLFINQGCTDKDGACTVSFKEEAAAYGIDHSGFSTHSAFFDYDLDGDLDMYLLCHSVHSTASYRDTATTRVRDSIAGDKLYENVSNGDHIYFTEVSDRAGIIGGVAGYGLGISIADLDGNGYPDIYIGNDFHENDFLYLNQGNKTFRESSQDALGHTSYYSMGNDLADINNDGWTDIVTLDMKPPDETLLKSAQGPEPYDIYRFKRSFGYSHQYPRNMIHLSRGMKDELSFSEVGQQLQLDASDWSWSALLADLNNDGWKDLFVTNGIVRRPNNLDYLKYISSQKIQEEATDLELLSQMPSGQSSNKVYMNQQAQGFLEVTGAWGMDQPSLSNGAAYADFDRDGDLDMVVNNVNAEAFYFNNSISDKQELNSLEIQFEGPEHNPKGVGTKVEVIQGENHQVQSLYPSKGWLSCMPHSLFFGLGSSPAIDSLIITWPDGSIQFITEPNANQILTVVYEESTAPPSKADLGTEKLFKLAESTIDFRHQENDFQDDAREPLIPYLISTQGPAIAIGDIDGDGQDDFYICGATGQKGSLFKQRSHDVFVRSLLPIDISIEETAALFFDADSDGDQDLYIGTGGNQYYREDPKLNDHLYLNDGEGRFTLSETALPDLHNQTACVEACDYDSDGDLDLFVGTRSVPIFYGKAPHSYILINDGSGHFAIDSTAPTKSLGMITDATWMDFDLDGDQDLVIVGDWMPITILKNEENSFRKIDLPVSETEAGLSGWWSGIEAGDIDNDGDVDLVIGNFGTNSSLRPTVSEPVRLYLADFDNNLSPDPIITYYRHGKEYPLEWLDALGRQLVSLKKKYRSYQEYSEKTVDQIFSEDVLASAKILTANQFNSVIALNDGQGIFEIRELPSRVQEAPVHAILLKDFDSDGFIDLVLAGNSYEVQPVIGRMDASLGLFLTGKGDGNFEVVENRHCGLILKGQYRDLKLLQAKTGLSILAARNNDTLQVIQVVQPS